MAPLPEETAGHGVALRRWRVEDAPALHEAVVASTEHLRPYMPWIAFEPQTVEQRVARIEGWEQAWRDGGDVVLGIWRDGTVVGGCGLHRRLGPHALEIGYWVHVDHVGQGIATAASRAATDLAFTMDGIDRVEIHHDVTNRASEAVPRKLGYERMDDIEVTARDLAPAETGCDAVWRITRQSWVER